MRVWQWITVLVLTVVSLLLTLSSEGEHHYFSWDSIPVFYILFGFIGCVVMILVPKLFGKFFLQKDERYYDAE